MLSTKQLLLVAALSALAVTVVLDAIAGLARWADRFQKPNIFSATGRGLSLLSLRLFQFLLLLICPIGLAISGLMISYQSWNDTLIVYAMPFLFAAGTMIGILSVRHHAMKEQTERK